MLVTMLLKRRDERKTEKYMKTEDDSVCREL